MAGRLWPIFKPAARAASRGGLEATATAQPGEKSNYGVSGLGAGFDVPDYSSI